MHRWNSNMSLCQIADVSATMYCPQPQLNLSESPPLCADTYHTCLTGCHSLAPSYFTSMQQSLKGRSCPFFTSAKTSCTLQEVETKQNRTQKWMMFDNVNKVLVALTDETTRKWGKRQAQHFNAINDLVEPLINAVFIGAMPFTFSFSMPLFFSIFFLASNSASYFLSFFHFLFSIFFFLLLLLSETSQQVLHRTQNTGQCFSLRTKLKKVVAPQVTISNLRHTNTLFPVVLTAFSLSTTQHAHLSTTSTYRSTQTHFPDKAATTPNKQSLCFPVNPAAPIASPLSEAIALFQMAHCSCSHRTSKAIGQTKKWKRNSWMEVRGDTRGKEAMLKDNNRAATEDGRPSRENKQACRNGTAALKRSATATVRLVDVH